MSPLFPTESAPPSQEQLEEGAWLLRGFASPDVPALISEIAHINEASPFRHLVTPSGHTMSAAMTNCGRCGWVSNRSGYRYDSIDPDTGQPWPPFPALFLDLAARAAAAAGFPNYVPDACLINRYVPGAKLSLHQDKDEDDQYAPIVSVSIGLPATFQWGGRKRADPVRRMLLESGDTVVWGGPARFVYHGGAWPTPVPVAGAAPELDVPFPALRGRRHGLSATSLLRHRNHGSESWRYTRPLRNTLAARRRRNRRGVWSR